MPGKIPNLSNRKTEKQFSKTSFFNMLSIKLALIPIVGNKHANQRYCAAKNNLFPNQDQL
jgi:hypothetical protein